MTSPEHTETTTTGPGEAGRTPRLVASDVDGTLIDADEQVSPRTAAAISQVVASGTPFVLVTGRSPRLLREIVLPATATGYAVCANGAVLYDVGSDRVLQAHHLTPALLRAIAAALAAVVPGTALAAERIGQSGVDGREFLSDQWYRHPWPGEQPAEVPRNQLLAEPAVKLFVRRRGMPSDQLAQIARTVLGGAVNVTFSTNAGLIEISASGTTKATGLAQIAHGLGIDPSDVVAFGDMPNDVSMLQWAGHGVAVANAHPHVLAVADEVTGPSSEDGVAQVLERWF